MTATGLIRAGTAAPCHPWPRFVLTQAAWFDMAHALRTEPWLRFVALWADATEVHALFQADAPLIASVAVEAGLYSALSPARPGAALFERAACDLWGHQAADATDVRPWLDHGAWPMLRPLSDRPVPNSAADGAEPDAPDMLEAPGDVIPMGPLPPTMAGPAYWRATMAGGAVRQLEARLGWGHRGIQGLMRGKSPGGAARLVARIDGAATVAHATAFARAVEAAAGMEAPPAAQGLRTLMLALERLAIRLHDAPGRAVAMPARETLLRACAAVFGHRLMMDAVRPGGVATDIPAEALAALDATLAALPPVPAMDGDIEAARIAVANVPAGPAVGVVPHGSAEGLGVADGPCGPVWHWVRLSSGVVAASFAAGPEWLMLPELEQSAPGLPLETLAAHVEASGLRTPGIDQ